MAKRYSIEIVDDLMTLLDGENNGCDAYVLRTYEAAKQQLERWPRRLWGRQSGGASVAWPILRGRIGRPGDRPKNGANRQPYSEDFDAGMPWIG